MTCALQQKPGTQHTQIKHAVNKIVVRDATAENIILVRDATAGNKIVVREAIAENKEEEMHAVTSLMNEVKLCAFLPELTHNIYTI